MKWTGWDWVSSQNVGTKQNTARDLSITEALKSMRPPLDDVNWI